VNGAPTIVLPIPDLGDELVRLRPWRVGDADALVAAWHDPEIVAGSSPPAVRSEEAAVRWIQGWDQRRVAGLAVDLVVADPGDDRVLAEVGLSRFDPRRRAAMIGWWVAAPERGRGVAGRAVEMLVDWSLEAGLEALVAEITEGNVASVQVAERCGFVMLRPATAAVPAVYSRR
jgi:RimJ/RimL family protein N-acetyltransferase